MTGQRRYDVPLEDLVASVRVPVDEKVEEHEVREPSRQDEDAGHLPGGVRPYGV